MAIRAEGSEISCRINVLNTLRQGPDVVDVNESRRIGSVKCAEVEIASLRVYVSLEPCDMRKSFNGLAAVVREVLEADPLSGAAFLFSNKRRNLIKILHWDGTGLWVVAKRLEKGTFSWPKNIRPGRRKLRLKPTALAMLTDGIDLRDGLRRPWYEKR